MMDWLKGKIWKLHPGPHAKPAPLPALELKILPIPKDVAAKIIADIVAELQIGQPCTCRLCQMRAKAKWN